MLDIPHKSRHYLFRTLRPAPRTVLVAIGTPEELKRERATGGGELPRLEDVFIGLIGETALAPKRLTGTVAVQR